MIITTASLSTNSPLHLLEKAQAAGFRLIVRSETTDLCCAGGSGGVLDFLIERTSLTGFSKFLNGLGFYRVAASRSADTATVEKFLGYCEGCAALMQLNLVTDVTIGDLSGQPMALRSTADLFDSVAYVGMKQTSTALNSISKVCAASMHYEYQIRSRQQLMKQARESFQLCELSSFERTCIALLGVEASEYVVKLMEPLNNWEVDLLLQELRAILENANSIAYRPARLFARKTGTAGGKKQRLTDTHAYIRRAPIVVISRTDAQVNNLLPLQQVLGDRIDARVVSFCTGDRGDTVADHQSDSREQSLFAKGAQVVSALTLAGRNFLRFRKMESLAGKGVVVMVPGYPVVDFPDGFDLPKLKLAGDADNYFWRLAARVERAVYERITAGTVDCLIVFNTSKHTCDSNSGLTELEERRRARAITNLPLNCRHKRVIDESATDSQAMSIIVGQVLLAAADG